MENLGVSLVNLLGCTIGLAGTFYKFHHLFCMNDKVDNEMENIIELWVLIKSGVSFAYSYSMVHKIWT